jgi:hypothetical protein
MRGIFIAAAWDGRSGAQCAGADQLVPLIAFCRQCEFPQSLQAGVASNWRIDYDEWVNPLVVRGK